ncbi:hypothetical protein Cgig2_009111 [Carnegiea gigantea]|uniref:Uncharacterized protein n=1 Tax=Carnegiea gigantea TaxID=171969 RepID=A0A9Q1JNK0_9CARY|nr:hypothetical protein Cgig2_009111 [Carnegiea gigantea]
MKLTQVGLNNQMIIVVILMVLSNLLSLPRKISQKGELDVHGIFLIMQNIKGAYRETNIGPSNFISGDDIEGLLREAFGVDIPRSKDDILYNLVELIDVSMPEGELRKALAVGLSKSTGALKPHALQLLRPTPSSGAFQLPFTSSIPPVATYWLHCCITTCTYAYFPNCSSTTLDSPIYYKIWPFLVVLCYYRIESTLLAPFYCQNFISKSLNCRIKSTWSAPFYYWNFTSTSLNKRSSVSKSTRSSQSSWKDNIWFDAEDEVLTVGKQFTYFGKGGYMFMRFLGYVARIERFCSIKTISWHKSNKMYKADIIEVVRVEIENEVFDKLMYEEDNPKRPISFGFNHVKEELASQKAMFLLLLKAAHNRKITDEFLDATEAALRIASDQVPEESSGNDLSNELRHTGPSTSTSQVN